MSSAMVSRLARVLHALVCELEDRDYSLEDGEDEYGGLEIVRDEVSVRLRWSEAKIELETEPTNIDKRKPSWTWNLKEPEATGCAGEGSY